MFFFGVNLWKSVEPAKSVFAVLIPRRAGQCPVFSRAGLCENPTGHAPIGHPLGVAKSSSRGGQELIARCVALASDDRPYVSQDSVTWLEALPGKPPP